MSDVLTDTPCPSGNAPAFLNGAHFIELDGKRPVEKKWNTDPSIRFDYEEAQAYLAEGTNVGVVLGSHDLVLDIDPRNFGADDSFEKLKADLSLNLAGYPIVETGSGGYHVYMRLPEGTGRLKGDLGRDGYPGIELKFVGRQVVAPGSVNGGAKVGHSAA